MLYVCVAPVLKNGFCRAMEFKIIINQSISQCDNVFAICDTVQELVELLRCYCADMHNYVHINDEWFLV